MCHRDIWLEQTGVRPSATSALPSPDASTGAMSECLAVAREAPRFQGLRLSSEKVDDELVRLPVNRRWLEPAHPVGFRECSWGLVDGVHGYQGRCEWSLLATPLNVM